MSTFRVYGMTESKARQMSRTLAPKSNESIEDYETRVQERFEKLMSGSKEVPLSASFDAPPVRQAVYRHSAHRWSLQKPAHQVPGAS